MSDKIRAFIAVPLPSNVIEEIGTLQSELKDSGFNIRWVRPSNIHLTLKFLGDITADNIAAIQQALKQAVVDHGVLSLKAKGIGVFPGIRKPRVIWVGIGGQTQQLHELQHSVETGLQPVGFAVEKRKFKSHLTLGRFKGAAEPDRLLNVLQSCSRFESASFVADRIHLYQSRLKPNGAVYSQLFDVPLPPV